MGQRKIALLNDVGDDVLALFEVENKVSGNEELQQLLLKDYKQCLESSNIKAVPVLVWRLGKGLFDYSCPPEYDQVFRHKSWKNFSGKFTTDVTCSEYQ
jgi:hypothetical protein